MERAAHAPPWLWASAGSLPFCITRVDYRQESEWKSLRRGGGNNEPDSKKGGCSLWKEELKKIRRNLSWGLRSRRGRQKRARVLCDYYDGKKTIYTLGKQASFISSTEVGRRRRAISALVAVCQKAKRVCCLESSLKSECQKIRW
ncbi:hypothetical protein R1flu_014194 [Riccia fluitans]|uniref:Ribosomal protein S14 n=1 Tax=Riccia fluitans TaxID=41844 RepID=A0ABD1YFE7_9MARC